jgi:hypothetical protein
VGLEAKTKTKGLLGRVTGKTAAPKLAAGEEMPAEEKPHGMPCL